MKRYPSLIEDIPESVVSTLFYFSLSFALLFSLFYFPFFFFIAAFSTDAPSSFSSLVLLSLKFFSFSVLLYRTFYWIVQLLSFYYWNFLFDISAPLSLLPEILLSSPIVFLLSTKISFHFLYAYISLKISFPALFAPPLFYNTRISFRSNHVPLLLYPQSLFFLLSFCFFLPFFLSFFIDQIPPFHRRSNSPLRIPRVARVLEISLNPNSIVDGNVFRKEQNIIKR